MEYVIILQRVPMDTHQKLDNTVDHVTTTHLAKDVDMIVFAQFLKCRYILFIFLMCAY